jgi:hypothetical protein
LGEFPGDLDFGSQNFAAGLDRNGLGGFELGGVPSYPSGGLVFGCLRRDFQDPAQLKTKPIYVAIGLAQGVANGVAEQGIVFRLFLGIIERDALKTVGALVQQVPRQDTSLFDVPDSHAQ